MYGFLLWLATKKGQWAVRVFALIIAVVVQYAYTAYAEKRAYNNGYLVAKAEYAEEAKTQSERITAQLNAGFAKQQELLNKQEVNYEKLVQITDSYKHLGDCHNTNGIGLLNEQIRKRNANQHSSITTKP